MAKFNLGHWRNQELFGLEAALQKRNRIWRFLPALFLPVASLGALFLIAYSAERLMRPQNAVPIEQLVEISPHAGNTLTRMGARYRQDTPFADTARLAFKVPPLNTDEKPGGEARAILMTSARRNVVMTRCSEPLQGGPGEWRGERFKYFAPHFYTLPSSTCEDDRVFIDLKGKDDTVRLRTVFIGPQEDIQTAYRMRRFFAIDLAMIATGVAATASILALAAAALGQNRTLFLAFSAMMACWSLRNLYYTGPLSEWRVEDSEFWFYATTYGLLVVSAIFINKWTINSRFVDQWLIAPIAGLFAIAIAIIAYQGFVTITLVDTIGWIVGLVAIALMFSLSVVGVYRGVGAPWLESFLFLTAGAGAVFDLVGTIAPGTARALIGGEGLTVAYASFMAIVATWAILVFVGRQNSFVQKRLEGANVRLQQKLSEREAALDQIYQEREREARETTMLRERQRIMQDIHDGFGGRLLALLLQADDQSVDRSALRDKLRDGLQDLRLIVDSMDTADGDIELAFGALRGRIEPDLQAANIELEWDIDLPSNDVTLGSRETLSIYRIIQEAVANTIRHSGADRMRISIQCTKETRLRVALSDNGNGFDRAQGELMGQGLRNMRNRVRELGGTITMGNARSGFAIEMDIPVQTQATIEDTEDNAWKPAADQA